MHLTEVLRALVCGQQRVRKINFVRLDQNVEKTAKVTGGGEIKRNWRKAWGLDGRGTHEVPPFAEELT